MKFSMYLCKDKSVLTMTEQERRIIDAVDTEMARLFEQRMAAVHSIALKKKAAGAPVEDLAREKAMVEARTSGIASEELKGYYRDFLRGVITVSKDYQRNLIFGETQPCRGIIIENGCIARAAELMGIDGGKVMIVTDTGVPQQYSRTVADSLGAKGIETVICTVAQGEANKSLESYAQILNALVEGGFTRTDAVVAVGGGVVGDMAGFATATFMRGIRFFDIPTTLLSQVDSSVGGKTAIDFGGVKNIVGAFHFAEKVLIDPETLATLPVRQLHNGLAEAIKMGATGDAALFELIENSTDLQQDLPQIIGRSIAYKKSVVDADPRESGLRRVLNFGHTAGHAIEACGAGKYLHGEAVALGMLYFADGSARDRIFKLLEKYDLPTSHDIPAGHLRDFITHDKKASGSAITVVKVSEIGSFTFEKTDIKDLPL